MLTFFKIHAFVGAMEQNKTFIGSKRETLAGEVRSEIERRILAGDLDSGQKLNEVALATDMDVSRGTMREAIRSLADSGLIDLVANRGAYVRRLTFQEISNLYELRGAIFAMACAAAAQHIEDVPDPGLLTALRDNLQAMQDASVADDRTAYYSLNIAFHDMIMDAARNEKAKGVYDGLVKEMHLFRRRGLSVAMNISKSLEEHADIVDAIASGDPAAARAHALRHVQSGSDRFKETLTDTGDGGESDDSRSRSRV
jgi:DNA-binding GntR family transcriptional regulator